MKNVKLIKNYNPRLLDLTSFLRNMFLLYTEPPLKTNYQQCCTNSVFIRNPVIKGVISTISIEDIIQGGFFIVIVIYFDKTLCNTILVLKLISRIVLEYIKVISRPTKIDVGRKSILEVRVKIITMF